MGRIRRWREEEAEALWAEAKAVLMRGGIIAVPTETFYGLAVDPFQEAALDRLFTLKGRPSEKPVLVLVDGQEMLPQLVQEVPELAARLMTRFWPGPLTIIFPARPHLPWRLTGGTGTIGVRQPRQRITCGLIRALKFPITGTSANRAGGRPLVRAEEVAREFGEDLDLILDAGPCPGGLPSTIVDITKASPRLVRAGAIPRAALVEIIPEMGRILATGEAR